MKSLSTPTAKNSCRKRPAKVLVLMALLLPTLLGILGLVIDSSMLMLDFRSQQQVVDAAATAAALELSQGETVHLARERAREVVQDFHGLEEADVVVNVGPHAGPYTGNENYVEVIVSQASPTYFIQAIRGESVQNVSTRAVAGIEESTEEASVVVLDPDPPAITLGGSLPLSVSLYPSIHLGGFEALGLGQLKVNGAVLVNTEWGGLDEQRRPVGSPYLLRNAMTCMPLLSLTKVKANDIRVVGGVDDPDNYGHYVNGEPNPLRANRRPVPDPLIDLPAPATNVDPNNISLEDHGAANVLNLPLLAPAKVLEPGVYDYINILTGPVRFEPGIYIIRGKNPLTQISLSILAGPVEAEGVMFYITNEESYSASNGLPDNKDGETVPPDLSVSTLLPSVVIDTTIPGNRFTPLDDPGSPFHNMLIYQRRTDRRPIVLVAEQLLGLTELAGMIYSKWGHIIFAGQGTYDLAICAGSVRIVNVLACELNPNYRFPPARDVYLVE